MMEKLRCAGFNCAQVRSPTCIGAALDLFLVGKRKDDVVIMKNGDKFTGEIKALQYGELIFKSSYMKDDVHFDWKEVKTNEEPRYFNCGVERRETRDRIH